MLKQNLLISLETISFLSGVKTGAAHLFSPGFADVCHLKPQLFSRVGLPPASTLHGPEVCCEFLIFSFSLSLSLFPPDLAVSRLCMAFPRDCSRAIKGKQHTPGSFITICSSYKTIPPREESLMNCFHKSLGLSVVFNYSDYQDCFCPRLKTCLCGLDRLLML